MSRIQWLDDLIRLEVVLWDRIDTALKQAHDLPLAFFEVLFLIEQSPDASLRVGDIAKALRITVGGTSKLVDRVEQAGLIRREATADDRRASRIVLTDSGRSKLAAARQTHDTEMALLLESTLSSAEEAQLHALIKRLLVAHTS